MTSHLAVVRLLPLDLGVWVCLHLSQERMVEGLWPEDREKFQREDLTYYIANKTEDKQKSATFGKLILVYLRTIAACCRFLTSYFYENQEIFK